MLFIVAVKFQPNDLFSNRLKNKSKHLQVYFYCEHPYATSSQSNQLLDLWMMDYLDKRDVVTNFTDLDTFVNNRNGPFVFMDKDIFKLKNYL